MKVSTLILATAATTASAAALPFGDGEWKFPNIRIGYAGAPHEYGHEVEKRAPAEHAAHEKRMGMPCHGAQHGAVARSSGGYGLGALLKHLGFDSYTAARYDSAVRHHHEHAPGHDGHHKDHGKDGHHHGGHKGHHGGHESDGAFAPPPADAELRILPIFGRVGVNAPKPHHGEHGELVHAEHQAHRFHGHHHPHAAAHRTLSVVLDKLDGAAESFTAFLRSVGANPAYLMVGYIVGAFLGIVASRKLKAARARRHAIQLDEEEAAAAPAVVAVVDEKN